MESYSVLMSVYSKETPSFLEEAIQSMLDQTVAPSEIVLVCDGPLTAELDSVIDRFCEARPGLFFLLRLEQNKGLGIALSQGTLLCKNEVIARMDTDDVALPDRMEKQLAFLTDHPNVSAVGSQIAEFAGNTGDIVSYREVPLAMDEILRYSRGRNPMNHMTVTFRKSDVLQAGGYRDFKSYEDWDLWIRMLSSGLKLANLPDVGVYARVDAGMYDRRSGFAYFLQAARLQRMMRELGHVGFAQSISNCFIRLVGALMPNAIRRRAYQMHLRKRSL